MHKALQSYNCNYNVQLSSNEVHLKLDADCSVCLMLRIPFCFEQILLSRERWLRALQKFPSEVLKSFFPKHFFIQSLKSNLACLCGMVIK